LTTTDCLEKPVTIESLVPAVNELFGLIKARASDSKKALTSAEATVLRHVLQGRTNRQIGQSLHRSPRTIEVHRSHIMRKLGASTIVDLVRAASARGLA
jgi:DNA-binding NarL/FixJ family response regulator